MNHQEMTDLLASLHEDEMKLRDGKGSEYTDGNPFANFEWGSDMVGGGREMVAWFYMAKHLTSIRMHINGSVPLTIEQLKEKVQDARLYLALIYGMEVDHEAND